MCRTWVKSRCWDLTILPANLGANRHHQLVKMKASLTWKWKFQVCDLWPQTVCLTFKNTWSYHDLSLAFSLIKSSAIHSDSKQPNQLFEVRSASSASTVGCPRWDRSRCVVTWGGQGFAAMPAPQPRGQELSWLESKRSGRAGGPWQKETWAAFNILYRYWLRNKDPSWSFLWLIKALAIIYVYVI